MKLLGIIDHSGPKYHRVLLPLTMMDQLQYSTDAYLTEENSNVDVVFFNRMIPRMSLARMDELREKNGFKLICDLDDHWRLDQHHMLYEDYKEFRTTDIINECVKMADVVTVTHERLYNEVLPFNKNVHILPNAIPDDGQFNIKKSQHDETRLFWAGGVTHKADLELIKGTIQRINLRKNKCKFFICGYVKGHSEWELMVKMFDKTGVNLVGTIPITEYYSCYSLCDISLIPLVDSFFNSHKSNLKILEAAHIGSPVIVSEVDPYLGFPDDLVNYVDGLNSTWYANIMRLVNDPVLRHEQGLALKEYCDRVYNFENINKHRREVFESVKH